MLNYSYSRLLSARFEKYTFTFYCPDKWFIRSLETSQTQQHQSDHSACFYGEGVSDCESMLSDSHTVSTSHSSFHIAPRPHHCEKRGADLSPLIHTTLSVVEDKTSSAFRLSVCLDLLIDFTKTGTMNYCSLFFLMYVVSLYHKAKKCRCMGFIFLGLFIDSLLCTQIAPKSPKPPISVTFIIQSSNDHLFIYVHENSREHGNWK